MIIDCHGHYTTAPAPHQDFRAAQLALLGGGGGGTVGGDRPRPGPISDDQVVESIETNQLRLLRERGGDLMIFSPRASAMGHHVVDPAVSRDWARACNDLVHRVAVLFPDHFAAACQLPQTPGGSLDDAIDELTRCVEELGFVGCLLNPDPSGGFWTSPPMTDPYWFPLYERLVALDVPAMIHVSSSLNPVFHDLGAHYINADTTVFMQLVQGNLFERFPTLRFVIPHGGGAVPYHWGRYRGLADRLGRPPIEENVMPNVFFDTAVYHQPGIDLLLDVVDADNILFASEMLGAVRGVDPATGHHWDDTKRYVDRVDIPAGDRLKIFEQNARRVFPRLGRLCP